MVLNSGLTKTTIHWSAPSRSAVIVRRERASTGPGESPQFQFRFRAGFDGELTDSKKTETYVSPIPNCPAHTNIWTQITPGIVEGEVSGVIGPFGSVQVVARGLGGRAIFWTDYTGTCVLQESTQVSTAAGVVTCPDEERWTASGKVVWGGPFTVIATCLSHWAGTYGASTDFNSSVTLRFTPCPGGGVKVARC